MARMRGPFVLALMTSTSSTTRSAGWRSPRSLATSRRGRSSRSPIAKRPLPVARLRAKGEVLEIGASDLAMNEDEARSLFERCGLDLGEADVATLTRRTEGWPVGLYLAALALEEGSSLDARVDAFAGTIASWRTTCGSSSCLGSPRKSWTSRRGPRSSSG